MKPPFIGLGTWKLKGSECRKAVQKALQLGYRHIDTAGVYENEDVIGEVISPFPRDEVFVTSKLWFDIPPNDVERICDATLKALNISYVDLYLVHWTKRETFLDILGAMEKLKQKGKAREIGVSNATVHHLEEALRAKLPVAVNQVEFHPFLNQKELLEFCLSHKIRFEAYSPLARGKVYQNETLKELGKKYNKTAGQVTLRWGIQKGVIPIPKATSENHLKENIEIFDFQLTDQEILRIDGLNENGRISRPEWSDFSY